MRPPPYRRQAAATAILMFSILAACQTDQLAGRSFPPEQRIQLQPGGPHKGIAETMTAFFDYRYTVEGNSDSSRSMQIDGGLNRLKMKVNSLNLYINFVDAQGLTIKRRLIYALGTRQGRGTFIRPSKTFASALEVPAETVYFAFNTRTQLSRGKK